MMTTEAIRIVIVDDEPLIRAGLASVLAAEPGLTIVGEAVDGSEVAKLVAHEHPDVVLMDVRMPIMDGIEATRRLIARDPTARILILTTFESDDYVYDALQAGANGFLLKRARPAEIVDAIRTIAKGDSLLFPAGLRRLVAASHRAGHLVDRLERAGLTAREADVLRLMADGLSNAEIAEALFLGVETIKTHVTNILMKLGARDRTQAVIAAYESGFITP